MQQPEADNRELRRLIRDLVALATTPAGWVGRELPQIVDGVADILLHTLRAEAVHVTLFDRAVIEGLRAAKHPGFASEVQRLRTEGGSNTILVETVEAPDWPSPLRVAIYPIGLSADDGFVAVGCSRPPFPSEAESLLLSVAANQAAVAIQTVRLRTKAEFERHRVEELLAQAPAAIGMMAGPEHRWLYVNEHLVRVTGRSSAADFVGKTLLESLPEIQAQPFVSLIDQVYRSGQPYVGREMRATLNRGHTGQPEEAYFDFVYQPIRNVEGAIDGVLVHSVEVTDRVLARKKIEESEERLRAIIETTPECVKLVGSDGTLLNMNPAGLSMIGADCPEAVLAKNVYDLIAPEDRQRFRDFNESVCRGNRGELEFDIVGLKGVRRHMETHAAPLPNPDGSLVHLAVARDVTERRRAEQALKESEKKYREFAESAAVALHWVGPDGTILWANQAELDMLGYSSEEYIGRHIAEFHVDAPVIHDLMARLCRGEKLREYEARLRAKDGSIRYVLIDSSALFENGKFIHTRCFTRDTTERKFAEQALRESEQRLRVVTDATPVMIWMSGTDKLCYYFNKGWLDFVGRTLEQEMGNGWAENVHPDDFERCVQIYVSSFDARRPFEMEYRLRHHSGQYRWILDHGVPRYAPDGTFEGYVGGCLDIHDKKEAAERTRIAAETVRRNNAVLELQKRTLEMLIQGEPLVDILSVVARAVRQLSERDMRAAIHLLNENGTQFQMAIAPDLPEDYRIATEGMAAATKTGPCCWAVLTREPVMVANVAAEERWSEFARFASPLGIRSASSLPILSADGKMLATLAMYAQEEGFPTSEDFKLMEVLTRTIALAIERQRMQDASRKLAAIVECSIDAIVSKDLHGIVTSWNPAAERLFGYSAQEMIGRPITVIIPPELQHDEARILATIARGERIEHFETVRVTKSGERIDVSLTISPVRDDSGRIVGAAKIARDITERKKAEQALRTTERLASVGRLAATVAHEINNPLEAVTNLVYLAKDRAVRDDVREFLAHADEELGRISHLTKQTLGFYRETRIASPVRVSALLAPLVAVFAPRSRNKGVEICPEILGDPEITAIPGEIRQLIANLLSNSIDAVNNGGHIRVRISGGSSRDGHQTSGVRITVADSGPGIPASIRERVFEPFFTTKKDVGTGLGLWVCKNIVENHHGSIRVKSSTAPGKSWTVISVFLPSLGEHALQEVLRQAV